MDHGQHHGPGLLDEGAELGHQFVDDLALGFPSGLVQRRDHDGDVVQHDDLAAQAHHHVAELGQQVVDVGGTEVVIGEPLVVPGHGIEGGLEVGFGDALVDFGEMEGLVEMDAEVAAEVAGDGFLQGDDAKGQAMHHLEMVGYLVDDGGLADAGACGEQVQLAKAKAVELVVELGIGDAVALGRALAHLVPEVLTGDDAVGPVGLGVPQGVDEFLGLAFGQAFVGVLAGQIGNLGLAWGQEHGAFLRRLASRLVHVEAEDDLLEGLQPFEVLPDGLGPGAGPVGQGDHGPLVVLQHGDGQAVYLTFRDDDPPAAGAPEVASEEQGVLAVAQPLEVLAFQPDVLGHHPALGIPVGSHMAPGFLLAPATDAVAELFAGGGVDAALLEREDVAGERLERGAGLGGTGLAGRALAFG